MAKPRSKELQYCSAATAGIPPKNSTSTSAPDPYLELELYLEKVNEEIGAVFEQWQHESSGSDEIAPSPRRSSEPSHLASTQEESYPDVVRQGRGGQHKNVAKIQSRKASAPILRTETNHLAEFERVVADELLALTPSASESSGASTPSPTPLQTTPTVLSRPRLLPDLLSVQQHDLVSDTPKSTATSPVMAPKEVENFLRKVTHTILNQDVHSSLPTCNEKSTERSTGNSVITRDSSNTIRKAEDLRDSSGLDAGTQTQDLSRSSSFTWLSSSSLLDSPASASSSSAPSGSTREESSAEDTSSSSEALLAKGVNNKQKIGRCSPENWLKFRKSNDSDSAHTLASSEWVTSTEPVWEPRDVTTETSDDIAATRDGAASDNEMPNQRKRKHLSARGEGSDDVQQAMQSPSLNSLRTVGTPLTPELGTKSSSAPVLAKQPPHSCLPSTSCTSSNGEAESSRNYTPVRSQSERHLSEIEAAEACRWMRAAGFPQYAQMYEDLQFPVDLNAVQKDHPFLDRDALQALFRRLHVLNKCARLRIDGGALAKNPVDDSDEEVECALSDNWTFLHQSRRWSRVSPMSSDGSYSQSKQHKLAGNSQESAEEAYGEVAADLASPSNMEEEFEGEAGDEAAGYEDEPESDHMATSIPEHPLRQYSSLPPGKFKTSESSDSEFTSPQAFRRSGSEKLRDGAKALLRRVESLKTRGKKPKLSFIGKGEESRVIGKPQVIDVAGMEERMRTMNCVDLVSQNKEDSSKTDTQKLQVAGTNLMLNVLSDADTRLQDLAAAATPRNAASFIRRPSKDIDDSGTQSDTDCLQWNSEWLQDRVEFEKDANSNNRIVGSSISHTEPRRKSSRKRNQQHQQRHQEQEKSATLEVQKVKHNALSRHGKSDDGGLADRSLEKETINIYESIDRSTFAKLHKKAIARGFSEPDDGDSSATGTKQKTVTRWHSFGRGSGMRQPSLSQKSPVKAGCSIRPGASLSLSQLSCGQLMVLRQLAMLQLTALMEKHCPTLRSTGFNWELPKFMKKCKSPQNKDQNMFGVSLLSSLQQTGHALPPAIQAAIQHLSDHALDREGIFRKNGLKSRIQKLRTQLINTGLNQPLELTLEEQQAYDVADVVKQFFRELPEALLTSKLSDTFLAIFQYVPLEMRHEAMKWAILLLPDQHREVLQCLLSFLKLVSSHAQQNQMTASNLSVCLAPSLFHSSPSPSSVDTSLSDPQRSASPRSRSKRRTKMASAGSPDAKELTESRAAHDCLLYLITNYKDLLSVSQGLLMQCHFSSLEQSIPVPLEELGSDMGQDWRGYMHACTAALLKEAKDRQRGWVAISSPDSNVEVAFKKVGDGHPLRLWRVSTEVEAPPEELLHRILREQHLWDPTFLTWRVLAQPAALTEVYQYACSSMKPLPPRDYCVLRSWRGDLERGRCVLVETSVEYTNNIELVPNAVRAIVLASRYLLEPCGSGRSRVLHLSRVDTKGRNIEWYNKCYGHLCALNLSRIRTSFSHPSEGPESKV